MNMFEEIDRLKKDLPKLRSVSKSVNKIDMNIYHKISLGIFIIFLFLGVLFGNLFPSCGSSSEFYSDICMSTEFNFSLMLFIWFSSFLVCLFIYAIGDIILLLNSIRDELAKK